MANLQEMLHAVQAVSPALAAALVSSVWQGLLLVGGIALALRLVRGVSPAVRAALWAAVLCLLLLLPLLTLANHPAMATTTTHSGWHVATAWSVGLLAAWSMLSVLRAGQLGWRAVRLWGLARRATPIAVPQEVAKLLEGRRRAVLCVSDEVTRPSVAGFVRPRILLPEGLLETLSAAELEHVVLHEMEHLRRGDDWLNLLQQLGLLLLPLQPALLWVDRELCRERELACDDRVLAATRERKAYAACLVKLAEDSLLRKGLAPALSALGARARESELVQRVRRILAGPTQARGTGRTHFAAGALGLLTVACAAALLRSPEWVHFDGSAVETAQAGLAAPTVTPDAPVLAAPVVQAIGGPASGRMQPVLASAVMSPGAGVRPRLVQALATTSVTAAPVAVGHGKATARKRIASHRSTLRALQVSDGRGRPAARTTPWVETALHERSAPQPGNGAGRVVLTEFEVVQPVYAAVAVGNGWLVFEL